MCGIAGYLSRTGADEPVGRVLLDMLTGLAKRGPDSAGLALYKPETDGSHVAWVRLPEHGDADAAELVIRERLQGLAEIRSTERRGGLVRLQLWLDVPAREISASWEAPVAEFAKLRGRYLLY